MKVILSAHIVWDKGFENRGPAHIVEDYLIKNEILYEFLKYPLSGSYFFLSHLVVIFRTIRFVIKDKSKGLVFIGVDPLNALSGWCLKKLGKVKIFIFHTPDYSPKKFENSFLNLIYHKIDRFCAERADFVWGVSERIIEKRLSQGVRRERLFWIPNSPLRPFFKTSFKPERKLVVLANLSNSLTFRPIFEALKKLENTHLVLIGSGKNEEEIKNLAGELGISDKIDFTGWLSYGRAIEKVKEASIGLAFYNNDVSWTHFCDPVKVRDYLACGLPVIMNDVPGVSEEIKEFRAGIVCINIAETIAKAVLEILKDEKTYEGYRLNAQKLANLRSSEKALDLAFKPIEDYL